ncbi:YdiK family protein [Mangrovibacillus cuniculi]|uniref:YdiK family protein n=1 Tax=Mangrovibacillus cuniculi TaxID=2593652 RepID=A0A7S8CE19_9BACI|nr:YdiK family protein [Mangrovibacillus cuniculi]QPC48207.1 YdiK family protein [Mangrovibacillus cuniculi]
MRPTPLSSGILYTILGLLFTFVAVRHVGEYGWGFFGVLIIFIATIDLGAGIRNILLHFKLKKSM